MWPIRSRGEDHRGVSPVVGVALLIVLLVLLVAFAGVALLSFGEEVPAAAPNLYVDMDPEPAGLVVTPEVIDHPIQVHFNGVHVMTIEPRDRHDPVLFPVAPDDEVQFIADVGRLQLLKQEHVDRHEAGDFIAYYTFEAGAGGTVEDRSANDNDATVNGATWVEDEAGTAMSFDGSDDYLKVDQLNVADTEDVSAFTVAIKYRITGDTGSIQQLVEHRNDTTNHEWYIETDSGNVPYRLHYTVWPAGMTPPGVKTGTLGQGDVHVVVGTYDGGTLDLYHNGSYVGSTDIADGVEMGALFIGADAVGASTQHLDGRIYQFRLYYTAFDAGEVETLTAVMEAEAE